MGRLLPAVPYVSFSPQDNPTCVCCLLRSCVDRPAEEPLCLGEPSPEPCSSESLCEFSAAKQGVKEWTGNVSCGCIKCKVCNISQQKALGRLQMWTFLIHFPNLVPWFLALMKMYFLEKNVTRKLDQAFLISVFSSVWHIPAELSGMPSWADLKVTSYCEKYRDYSLKGGDSLRNRMKTLQCPSWPEHLPSAITWGRKAARPKKTKLTLILLFWTSFEKHLKTRNQ